MFNACFAVAAPIACILQCNPISKYWDHNVQGKCVDAGAYTVSTSSIVLTTDILVLLMPSWILHDLKMPLGRKLMVIAFLSFGILVTVVGAVRTSVLVKVFVIKQVVADPTYEINYVPSNIESGLAIIGTCGPTIKCILSCCIPSLKSVDESHNRGYVYPTGRLQGDAHSKRLPGGTRTHKELKEIDEIELTKVSAEEIPRVRRNMQHADFMAITKTIAWKVDETQEKDSGSANGEQTPRLIL